MTSQGFSRRFDEALVYASSLHRTQTRKGNGCPYVSHLLGVASIVIENGGDEDAAIAALLHDAMEDQGGVSTLNEIRERWGAEVADIVRECSDNEGEPKRPWIERKQDFIALIPTLSGRARLVALADKLHNIRSVLSDYNRHGESVWIRFNGGRAGTLWYYRAALTAFRSAGNQVLVDDLAAAVEQLFNLAGEPETVR